ncbi:MAG TPA: choice-of-anchor Q domain-containing protein [bacterium]|nr:choice-of-anchor Q domain-containing protein [bacterium]
MKKKMFLLLLIALVFSISCKKEKKIAIDDISDEDILIFDEDGFDSEPVQDESDTVTDEEETDDLSDGVLTDSDEDLTDEDAFVPLRFYVNINATGANTGLSWEDAFTKLQDAIDLAEEGYEIWVAKGTFKPSRIVQKDVLQNVEKGDVDIKRFYHFSLKNNIAVLGGFSGTETKVSQRNWVANETILSGDIDNDGKISQGDSFNVILNINIDVTTIFDGFIITGGNSDFKNEEITSTPFQNGGGMNNYNSANLTVKNCVFHSNRADVSGGAVANFNSNPVIEGSIFKDNSSLKGGAISNFKSHSDIRGTLFKNNNAQNGYGGAVFNGENSRGKFDSCDFISNSAFDAGAVANNFNSATTFDKCKFISNLADSRGGAMTNAQSSPKISNSIFDSNISNHGGGAIENYEYCSPVILNTIFKNNSVTGLGDGGALLINTGKTLIVNSLFINNSAYNGGAMALRNTNSVIISSTFVNNLAAGDFGYGGAIFNESDFSSDIINTIIWENKSNYKNDQIYNSSQKPLISFSNIQNSFENSIWNNEAGVNVENNFDTIPVFIDPSQENFSLLSSSPCIDKGTNAPFETGGIAVSFQEDLAGNPRISNELTDVGAYEYQK